MTADQSPAPIEYASAAPPAAPAPRPGFWRVVCFALGWIFVIFGSLGLLANCALIFATWYFDYPVSEHERVRRMWMVPGTLAYFGLGFLFLWLRYRKRGAR